VAKEPEGDSRNDSKPAQAAEVRAHWFLPKYIIASCPLSFAKPDASGKREVGETGSRI
jgi:hypothetical protein